LPEFNGHPAFELVRRLELRGAESSSWSIFLQPPADSEEALSRLIDELSAQLECPVRAISVAGQSIEYLRQALHSPDDDIVVVTGADAWNADAWSAADVNRSGLTRPGSLILYLSVASLERLCRYAPNIQSFIGGSIFQLAPGGDLLDEAGREQRLRDLSDHYHLQNAEVVRKAMEKSLPAEPEFVEWLVLLGRGDLI
jgi:hypothetical protein